MSLFWWAVACYAVAVPALLHIGWRILTDDVVSPISGWVIMIFGTAALALTFTWWVDTHPSPPDPTPARQCVIKELQQVWYAKSYHPEWVCTGWSEQ